MEYLIDLGFTNDTIEVLNETIPKKAKEALINKRDNVVANINYLKDLGVSNYIASFVRFYNMFLLDPASFDEIFSKYDHDDLVAKIEKNVAILEYL